MTADARASFAATLRYALAEMRQDLCQHGGPPELCVCCWTAAHGDEQNPAGPDPHRAPVRRSDRNTATKP